MPSSSFEKKQNASTTMRLVSRRAIPGKNTESGWPKSLLMVLTDRDSTVRVLSYGQSVSCGAQQGVSRRESTQDKGGPCGGIATKRFSAPGREAAVGQCPCFEEPHRAGELSMLLWQGFDLLASQRGQQGPGNLHRCRSDDDHKQTWEDKKY